MKRRATLIALGMTYANAAAGIVAIYGAMLENYQLAFLALIIAALLDVSDGAVARLRSQSAQERTRGIIADSLADALSFGVAPAVILLSVTHVPVWSVVIALVYVILATHRLVVFSERGLASTSQTKVFSGMPVIMGAMIITASYAILGNTDVWQMLVLVLMPILALLFISRIPIVKPHGRSGYIGYVIIATLLVIGVLI